MSSNPIKVIALLMDHPEGLLITDLKIQILGKGGSDPSFERLVSDLIGMGCAYVLRYEKHIPVIRLQSKRFEVPNAEDTYTGLEASEKKRMISGIRYRTVSSVVYNQSRLSAWTACSKAGVDYLKLWKRVNKRSANPTDEDFQVEFAKLVGEKLVEESSSLKREPQKKVDHVRPPPKPTTFSNVVSVFSVAESANKQTPG